MQKSDLEKATDKFIDALTESSEYRAYCEAKAVVREEEELWKQICEFRKKMYEFQNSTEPKELFDRVEVLEREYREWLKDERVRNFLDAELAFCRLFQETNMRVVAAMQFE